MSFWPLDPGNPAFLLIAFPLLWIVVCGALAIMSGWWSLSGRFADRPVSGGTVFRMASISMGMAFFPINYSKCVSLRIGGEGFRLSVWYVFRFLHPALFVPWREVVSLERQKWLLAVTRTRVLFRDSRIELSVFGQAGLRLMEAYEQIRSESGFDRGPDAKAN